MRGRDIKRDSYNWAGLYIILAYFDSHLFLEKKCPSIYDHLKKFKSLLENRGQCKYLSSGKTRDKSDRNYPGYPGMHHWLELDNCPSKKYLEVFDNQIIAWQRITQSNNFCITEKKMLVLDSMAFLASDDQSEKTLAYLSMQLNSPLFFYWMRKTVHEYGETGFRLSNQFVEVFPALLGSVDNLTDIYKKYNLSTEEILIIENTK